MAESARSYPEQIEITPPDRPVQAEVRVPGSKSITNRALVLAALSDTGLARAIRGVLRSEDTEVMIECLRQLGATFTIDWEDRERRPELPKALDHHLSIFAPEHPTDCAR